MLRKILIALVALVVIFVAYVATRPSSYSVQRSTQVAAPPEIVYAQVSDFHRWDAWSPWAKLDPKMKATYSGAAAGKGAVYEWSSAEKNVGKGRMTITDVSAPRQVKIDLVFMEPYAGQADTTFAFSPEGGGTKVTWTMGGNMGFMEKAMGIFMNMDAMIGNDFEKGLGQLRTVSEGEAQKAVAAALAAQKAAEEAAKAKAAEEEAAKAAAAKHAAASKKKGKKK